MSGQAQAQTPPRTRPSALVKVAGVTKVAGYPQNLLALPASPTGDDWAMRLDVPVLIRPEPENPYSQWAQAVLVWDGSDWTRVGYLPDAVAKLLHEFSGQLEVQEAWRRRPPSGTGDVGLQLRVSVVSPGLDD